MTIMSRFLLVNQNRTAQPVLRNSQMTLLMLVLLMNQSTQRYALLYNELNIVLIIFIIYIFYIVYYSQ